MLDNNMNSNYSPSLPNGRGRGGWVFFSIIVPVYNRPDEVDELLASLCQQTVGGFEVVIVEDGSAIPCEDVCRKYEGRLDIHYYNKTNSGPGQSRNYGAERASGDFLLILDSDVILPPTYIENVGRELAANPCKAFGGPDASHPSFTPVQKAISYSMTSFFTTGGIRGGRGVDAKGVDSADTKPKKALDKFFPRSFNMGIEREVYHKLGGFTKMRFGEDIDFSYRIVEAGYNPQLFPSAWVYHKRRTDFRKFFRQVYNSGIARINLEKRHPGTMKLVHMLPALFTLALLTLLPIIPYAMLIFLDSSIQNRSLKIGLLSVPAAFVQLTGYGCGFLYAFWQRIILGKDEFHAFEKTFYK